MEELVHEQTQLQRYFRHATCASYKESLKAIFSFETGIENEDSLNQLVEHFLEKDSISSFLSDEILEKEKNLLIKERLKNMNANTTALINQINENMKYYAMREFESDDIEQQLMKLHQFL